MPFLVVYIAGTVMLFQEDLLRGLPSKNDNRIATPGFVRFAQIIFLDV
jgi:hypothetical protein